MPVNEKKFADTLFENVPSWALGAIGTLFAFAIVLKIIGIDFAGPINDITEAYTSAMTAQAKGMETINAATSRMEAVSTALGDQLTQTNVTLGRLEEAIDAQQQVIRDHETRLRVLENMSNRSGPTEFIYERD